MQLRLDIISASLVSSLYRQCLLGNSTEAYLNNYESFQADMNLPQDFN